MEETGRNGQPVVWIVALPYRQLGRQPVGNKFR